MARILGVDYGEKRIGVAMTDENAEMALPYAVVNNTPRSFSDIRHMCEENNIVKIVIGLPIDLHARETDMTRRVRIFAQRIHEETGIPVNFENEMLSTKEASHIQGKTSKIDASAAALILDSYMKKNRIN